MEFEWDEDKRLSNLEKLRIDFVDVDVLFDGRPTYVQESHRGAEERQMRTGEVSGRIVTIVWTQRGDRIRIVSARRARHAEERNYRSL